MPMQEINQRGSIQYSTVHQTGYSDSSPTLGGTETPYNDSQTSFTKYAPVPRSARASRGSYAAGVAPHPPSAGKDRSRRRPWLIAAAVLAMVAAIAIAVPIAVIKSRDGDSSSTNGNLAAANGASSSSASNAASSMAAAATTSAAPVFAPTFGGDGSMIESLGLRYNNSFGGTWDAVPFSNRAQANNYSPPLNQSWDWQSNRIFGVNVGGWLHLEPFINADLFNRYQNTSVPAVDEWTLMNNLDALGIKRATMENHYATFITERDFALMAAAGLNWIRLPIGHWLVDTWGEEPFYVGQPLVDAFVNALSWARKYGLRVNLDLHTSPGSANGWDHSGRRSAQVNFMNGPMGVANAQRYLNYVVAITQFVSQPQWRNVVQMFSPLNEPYMITAGQAPYQSLYTRIYQNVRAISGLGAGNGPMLAFGDGFIDTTLWNGFLSGADRVALDRHSYIVFQVPQNSGSPLTRRSEACSVRDSYRASSAGFGYTSAGEWSLATTDCGLYLAGVGYGNRYEGTYATGQPGAMARTGSCATYLDYPNFSASLKSEMRQLAQAWRSSLWNSFFWTWKTAAIDSDPRVQTPQWSYSLGLEQGWIDQDPRTGASYCGGGPTNNLTAAQVGGTGAGTNIDIEAAWPPTVSSAGPYRYAATGTPVVLRASNPVYHASTYDAGSGIANSAAFSSLGWYTSAAGSTYADPWWALSPGAKPTATLASRPAAAAGAGTTTTRPTATSTPVAVAAAAAAAATTSSP